VRSVSGDGVELAVLDEGEGQPVLLLHGFPDSSYGWRHQVPVDAYLTNAPVLQSATFVTGPWRYERIDGAGHWMQVDAPERVNELLLDFLT
jgi:pimeloyl-ACP methyl ester carboxylesterase